MLTVPLHQFEVTVETLTGAWKVLPPSSDCWKNVSTREALTELRARPPPTLTEQSEANGTKTSRTPRNSSPERFAAPYARASTTNHSGIFPAHAVRVLRP